MHGICTHKNGITTATKYCPACGRLGLEFHETEHLDIRGGNLTDTGGCYFSCPVCGYSGDGEQVPPELPEELQLDDERFWDGDVDIFEEV
jgi:hypothetical protein